MGDTSKTEQKVEVLDLDKIDFRAELNARPISAEHVAELKKLIKRDGMQQKPVVRPVRKGKEITGYQAVIGFHRLTVAKELGWKTIPVEVQEMEDETAGVINVVDGLSHQALTTYEVATAVVNLCQKFKLDDDAVTKKLNLSKKYVQALIRCRTKLIPKILEEWQKGNGACTKNNMEVWAAMPAHEQLPFFEVATGERKADENGKPLDKKDAAAGTSGVKETKPKALKYDVLKMAKVAANKRLADGTETAQASLWCRAVNEALAFAMGESKEIKGIFKIEESKPKKLPKEAIEAIKTTKDEELTAIGMVGAAKA